MCFQARVGVMLVGPTGGGKTTVRTILEKALVILPTLRLEKISKNDGVLQVRYLNICSYMLVLSCWV